MLYYWDWDSVKVLIDRMKEWREAREFSLATTLSEKNTILEGLKRPRGLDND